MTFWSGLPGERDSTLPPLTPRQRELLKLILDEGLTMPKAAKRLGISYNTVKIHLANARTRVGVHTTVQLLLYAERNGLLK